MMRLSMEIMSYQVVDGQSECMRLSMDNVNDVVMNKVKYRFVHGRIEYKNTYFIHVTSYVEIDQSEISIVL